MKALFHKGQAVACIISSGEWFEDGGQTVPTPQKGSIYHVLGSRVFEDIITIELVEFGARFGYDQEGFTPVQEAPAELVAELLECLEPTVPCTSEL